MSLLMRKEINEQPEAIRKTLTAVQDLDLGLNQLAEKNLEKIVFIARGTSDNVATYGLFLIPIIANVEAYSISPSLLNSYGVEVDLRKTLVIAISQSGETQEIVSAAKTAKSLGASLISITNNKDSSLENISDVCLITPAGKETAVPATKTYTSALAGLAAIVSRVFDKPNLLDLVSKVPSLMESQLSEFKTNQKVVELLAAADTAVFAGRGIELGAVFEAALKLKETSQINVIGTSVADFVHGPIAALSKSVPLVILSADTNSPVYPGLIDLVQRARATRSPIVTIGCFLDNDKEEMHVPIGVFSELELIAPLVLAIPTQLLAADVSDFKGLNADSPTVLNKVTQTS
jgi:glucosamine--fructose-6-phosphate aminotransferase (isomerizing)